MKSLKILLISALFLIQGCSLSNANCAGDCCKTKNNYNITDSELKVVNLDTFSQSRPLVCTLVGQEKIERKEALKKEIFSQINELEELELGYVFKFDASNNLLLKIIDYVIVERECCPFFKYDFSIQPYNNGIELKVSGTKDAKELIKMFVEEIQYERK